MRKLWICVFLMGCSGDVPPTPIPVTDNGIGIILDNTNAARAQYGLPPYVMNVKLRWAAQKHAENMAKRNQLSHFFFNAPPGERTPSERVRSEGYESDMVGENASQGSSPETVVNAWMHSPGHRAAILSRQYNEIGIGMGYSGNQTPYGCQVFGRSQSLNDK